MTSAPSHGRAERLARANANRQLDLHVVVEDVYKEQNASSILRTAEAVGVGTLHVVRTDDLDLEYTARITRGAEQWIATEFHREPGSCIARLTAMGLRIYCTALSARAVGFREVDYTLPCAVVFGNEAEGASGSFAALADACIMIPMMGLSQSLNVAAAAAAVLYEAQRQRAAAGMYADHGLGPVALAPQTRGSRGGPSLGGTGVSACADQA
jgi:tRNA (guanosine-2'-O-)-methyltransferase